MFFFFKLHTLYVEDDLYGQNNTDDWICQFWKATVKTSDIQYVL